jgi:hypothetical protein
MGDFEAVVAGGGPNGLAAALRLAEAGWPVYLAEANPDVPRRWPLGPDGGVHPVGIHPCPGPAGWRRTAARGRDGLDRSGEAFADRMEATIEAHAPGFRELILARRVWDAGRPGGCQLQRGRGRHQRRLVRRRPATVVPTRAGLVALGHPGQGLHLAGASVLPGAGVHGACGDLAARQVLADQHRAGRLAAAAASEWPWPPSKQPGTVLRDEPPGGIDAHNGSQVAQVVGGRNNRTRSRPGESVNQPPFRCQNIWRSGQSRPTSGRWSAGLLP